MNKECELITRECPLFITVFFFLLTISFQPLQSIVVRNATKKQFLNIFLILFRCNCTWSIFIPFSSLHSLPSAWNFCGSFQNLNISTLASYLKDTYNYTYIFIFSQLLNCDKNQRQQTIMTL